MGLLDRFTTKSNTPSNPTLIHAMQERMRADSLSARQTFYRELLCSTLLAAIDRPIAGIAKDKPTTLKQRIQVGFITTHNTQTDEPVILIFTDMATMASWNLGDRHYLALATPSLFSILLENHAPDVVLCSPKVVIPLRPDEVHAIAARRMPPQSLQRHMEEIQGNMAIGITPITESMPEGLLSHLHAALHRHPEVAALYVFFMTRGNNPSEFTVCMTFTTVADSQHTQAIVDETAQIFKPYIDQGRPLTFLPLTEHDSLMQQVRTHVAATYQRA